MNAYRLAHVPFTLADATPRQRIRVRRVRSAPASRRCRELGIVPGVIITWLRFEGGKIVVRFPEGHTTAVEVGIAPLIEVDAGPSSWSRVRSAGRWP
jgi:Fe2+ transport system protein FeoA